MEPNQSDTLNNTVDWNDIMGNINTDYFDKSEFDKYIPSNAVETVNKKTTADKCIQTDLEDESRVFIDLTNDKKKQRREKRAKKHKKRKIETNEIILVDSEDEEANKNDKNCSPNDASDFGLTSMNVKPVRCIIKAIKANEEEKCSPQQTANPQHMVVIESDDEIQNTINSNGCHMDGFEQRPVMLNTEICQE